MPRPFPRGALFVAFFALSCRGRNPPPPRPEPPPAPPARPADVVATAHLGRPRATMDTLGTAAGTRLPADFLLALSLGVDVALLAAIDNARPIDIALLAAGDRGAYVVAMTPPTSAHARSALASRYRFVHVEGLGERVEPRGDPGLSDANRRIPCALVAVPSTVTTRVVCGSDAATLARAGRWVAWESAARAENVGDFELAAEGESLRRDVVPWLRGATQRAQQRLAADASAARREHERPPDYGDPEAMAALLGDAADEAVAAVGALSRATLRADVTGERAQLTADLTVREGDASLFAADARDRVTAATEHPLAAMLPADAWWMFDHRGGGASRASLVARATDAAMRVLGERVTNPTAARADLDALFARAGDEVAWSVARDGERGFEVTAAVAQTDGGANARAVLARMARAPWLRTLRLGSPLVVSPLPDGLAILPMSALVTAPIRPPPSRALAAGVRGGALVLVVGTHARNTLDGFAARGRGAVPALLTGEAASVVGGADLAALGMRDLGRAQFSYAARRAGDATQATLRLSVPTRLLASLRALLQ